MSKRNCHTCKGLHKCGDKYYCNIKNKKPSDANLLLEWYNANEISKLDLPCKEYQGSTIRQDDDHTPARHAPHDPYRYYDNLTYFLLKYGYTMHNAKLVITRLKAIHQLDCILELSDANPVLLVYNLKIYEQSKVKYKYDVHMDTIVESNDGFSWKPCKKVK